MLRLNPIGNRKNIIGIIYRGFHSSKKKCLPLKMLTRDQKQQYDENGYTVVHNILSESEVQRARDALKELIERTRTIDKEDGIYELGTDHCYDQLNVNRIRFPSTQHPVFDLVQKHPKILDCVQDLIGPSFRYMPQDKLNVKPAGYGTAIPWHQDWAFFPHTNDSVLTASVLLYDSTRENGCLQVVPGSHKGKILSHQDENNNFTSMITEQDFNPENVAYLECKSGAVTFHHVRVIHGSARNVSSTPRSIVCNIYASMDAWPLLGVAGSDFKNTGPVDFDAFDETRVRGVPCNKPRLENVPVILPIPFEESSTVFSMNLTPIEPKP